MILPNNKRPPLAGFPMMQGLPTPPWQQPPTAGPFGVPPQTPMVGAAPGAMPPAPGAIDPVGVPGLEAPAEDEDKGSKGFFKSPWTSDGLLALGAGLLSGNGFADGLAKGAMGMQKARNDHAERNKVKRTMLANGAFTLEENPDGTQRISKNDEVSDHIYDLEDHRFGNKMTLEEMKQDSYLTRMAKQFTFQEALTQMRIDADNGNQAAQRAYDRLKDDRRSDQQWRMFQAEIQHRPNPYDVARLTAQGKADVEAPAKLQSSLRMGNRIKQGIELLGKGSTGAGKGWVNSFLRGAVEATGQQIGKINPGDMDELNAILGELTLNKAQIQMDGQGAVTNFERALVSITVPQQATDVKATLNMLRELYKAAQADAGRAQSGVERGGTVRQSPGNTQAPSGRPKPAVSNW